MDGWIMVAGKVALVNRSGLAANGGGEAGRCAGFADEEMDPGIGGGGVGQVTGLHLSGQPYSYKKRCVFCPTGRLIARASRDRSGHARLAVELAHRHYHQVHGPRRGREDLTTRLSSGQSTRLRLVVRAQSFPRPDVSGAALPLQRQWALCSVLSDSRSSVSSVKPSAPSAVSESVHRLIVPSPSTIEHRSQNLCAHEPRVPTRLSSFNSRSSVTPHATHHTTHRTRPL